MSESRPRQNVRIALFALSGNECAFPDCDAPVFDQGSVVGEIAHIHGRKPSAARYEDVLSDEEINSIENLILLCSPHHKIVDDGPDEFDADRLRQMKKDHESRAATTSSEVPAQLVNALAPPAPDEWRERPGAPVFHFDLSSNKPQGQRWTFNVGVRQISGGEIGVLRFRFLHGLHADEWLEAHMREAGLWRLGDRQVAPQQDLFSVELKLWWDGAERVFARRWATEDDFQTAKWTDEYL